MNASPLALSSALHAAAAAHEERNAVTIDGGESLTYGAWWDRVAEQERAYRARGITTDHPVTVIDDDPVRSLTWMAAAWQLRHSVVLLAPSESRRAHELGGVLARPDRSANQRGRAPVGWPVEGGLTLLSSGTTGTPKVVVHSDDSVAAAVHGLQLLRTEALGATPRFEHAVASRATALRSAAEAASLGLVYLSSMPLSSAAGITIALQALCAGDELVILNEFTAERWFRAIAERRATNASLAPLMAQTITRTARTRDVPDLSSLLLVGIGGGPVSSAVATTLEDTLGAATAIGYGTTETLGPITFSRFSDAPATRHGTVGRPIPGAELRLSDGVLEVRTPALCAGYLRPDGQLEDLRDADGYWRTGDAAERFDDGSLMLRGRVDDVIVRGGRNIDPAPIEQALESHPNVEAAAVVGVRARLIETDDVVALVVLARKLDAQDLRRHCLARIGQAPQRIVFVDALPRTRDGSVIRAAAKRLASAGL